jgi:GT2 family glycosyltransferase
VVRVVFVGRYGDVVNEGGEEYVIGKNGSSRSCEVHEDRAKGLIDAGIARLEGDGISELTLPKKESDEAAKEFRLSLPTPPDAPPLWVVVATRDRPKCAIYQAKMLLAQGPDMVVVVNDGGPDPEIHGADDGARFGLPMDERLTYVRRARRGGPNAARHDAITLAPKGAVIVELDDHDYVEDGAVDAMRRAFADKSVQAVYGDHYRVNSKFSRLPKHGFVEKGEYYPGAFMERGALHTGMRAYRKSLYVAVGGYRMSEMPAGDLGLFLRFEVALGSSGFVHLPRPLCSVVVSMDGISVAMREEQAAVARRLKALASNGLLFCSDEEIKKMGDPGAAYERAPEPDPPSYADVREEIVRPFEDGAASDVDVIAVIPSHNPRSYLARVLDCLKRDGVPAVVIDDACPQMSGGVAARHKHPDLKVVKLSRNCGFARSVNVGARHALERSPRALLMLNADAFPRDGAIKAMVARLRDDAKLGIVGNTHLNSGNGGVQSEGSEWSWDGEQYKHVGRNIEDPLPGDAPKRRDMVTFACCLIRSKLWRAIDGLDERFREAYWEDADLCMRAREAGWEIEWIGGPATEHICGASKARRSSYADNARLFRDRWLESGLVDKFALRRGVKVHDGAVVGCMIACEEEEFIDASLRSVYPLVDKLVVVVGGTKAGHEAGLCGDDGLPRDGTVAALESFDDPDGKLEIVLPSGAPWTHKRDMREEYAKRLRPGDWMLLLDADEVFSEEGLWRLSRHMHRADVVMPGFWLVWNKMDTVGTGKWDGYPQYKAVRWQKGYTYANDDNVPCDERGRPLSAIPRLRVVRTKSERLYVHYSWVRPLKKIKRKIDYYRRKPNVTTRPRDGYFEKVFLAWRESPRRVEAEYGTHPFGGGGARKLPCEHPEPVLKLLRAGLIGGTDW